MFRWNDFAWILMTEAYEMVNFAFGTFNCSNDLQISAKVCKIVQTKNSMFQKLVIIALQTVIFKTIEFKIKFRQTWQIDS